MCLALAAKSVSVVNIFRPCRTATAQMSKSVPSKCRFSIDTPSGASFGVILLCVFTETSGCGRKWRGVPVWSHAGMICTGETYRSVVKMTFFKGASLKDPAHLFNSSLEGKARRAIDLHEGEEIDGKALKALVRAAVTLNRSSARR